MPMKDVAQNPQAVWEALQAGNKRFVHQQQERPNQDILRRTELRAGQNPRAVVLSCSDSRVPVELIFDVGLGDLFVVRTAGEILDPAVLASIEYAIKSLGVELVVVMGHESCGAVAATAEALDGGKIPNGLERILIEKVAPSILEARARGRNDRPGYERQHVIEIVIQIKHRLSALQERIADGRVGIVGLRYLLSDGSTEQVIADGVE
ncbi:MAG TPA: carbonic anhydrase [Corynebacterium pollutisoli]|uniref:Carbonic anhydrase n=1 Tax=Corynebacterium pollutisoli TaxID=1610489 RepID=A0A7X8MTM8_9CORY|nr:carbonic anhydrase [Corynebacterium pollutisoli]HJD79668.1 carbonic anhydrase [Corynebacterium pollutisoli]